MRKLNPIHLFFDWLERRALGSTGQSCVTDRGEKVKSNIERRIANSLNRYDIVYVYEKPLRVWFLKWVRPDFYLPKYDLWIEYHGLLQHPTRGERYRKQVEYKRKRYKKMKLKFFELDHRHAGEIEKYLWQELKKYV